MRSAFALPPIVAILALAGCASDQSADQQADADHSKAAVSAPQSTQEKTSKQFAPRPAEAYRDEHMPKTAVIASEKAPAEQTVADYQPPFPDRVDLFVPPKRQGGARTNGQEQDAVELLGFVRVDRPKAVLSINGQVASIAEGSAQFGVEVVSIQPPKVVLQRGRQRWQAGLDN